MSDFIKNLVKWSNEVWFCRIAILALSPMIVGQTVVLAQIKPDTTLGNEASLVKPKVDIKGAIGDLIDGGAVRGANLFHSFREFSIVDGQRVYFSNPTGVENILTRVAGNNRSDILGTLGVLGNANLFLINPKGIFFGENAKLDIAGSFVASTAASLVFGNGFAFGANNPQAPPLLTINVPLGLQFGVSPGSIQVQAASLQGADSKTLALLGGNVSLDGGFLSSFGGRIELGGLSNSGTIGLEVKDNHLNLQFPESVERADVSLLNTATSYVTTENGGSMAINARKLQILGDSQLAAINDLSENATGSLLIDATDSILVDGLNSSIGSLVASEFAGNGADLKLTTPYLSLVNGAQIYTITFGQGKAGNININASNSISLEGLGNSPFRTGLGSQTTGKGDGGDILLTTGTLSLTNNAQIGNLTVGSGNAGNLTIIADSVSLTGRSLAASLVGTDGQGNGGEVEIFTKFLFVTDGAQIGSNTAGKGNAGDITIRATDAVVFDNEINITAPTGAFSRVEEDAIGQGGKINISTNSFSLLNGAKVDATTFGQGHGGNISIATQTLFVKNGSQISAGTRGEGNAGNIKIDASDTAQFDGVIGFKNISDDDIEYAPSGLFTTVVSGGVGKGGNLTINTRNLAVTNGATFNSATFGQGDAGNVTINASDSALFDGFSGIDTLGGSKTYFSGISSTVESEAVGNGGTINLTTKALFVNNYAQINASTAGQGDAGNIKVTANTFDAVSGGKLLTSTSSTNPAGDITLRVSDRVTITGTNSGIFANTTLDATGNSGNIFINPQVMILRDGAKIAVDNQGSGTGGIIHIQAGTLTLDNDAVISAETASNTGGNIQLQLKDLLLLRRNSLISTTAGTAQAGGNGGNITINTPFIVAFPSENNDITANAFIGNGGRVDITAQSIFGLTPRTRADLERLLGTNDPTQLNSVSLPTSDITAISQANPSLNGQVNLNTLDTDPNNGLVALPTNIVDAAKLISQTCRGAGGTTASQESEFVITGRGGLPANPSELLNSDAVWYDLQPHALLNETLTNSQKEDKRLSQRPAAIVEAQGWVIGADGSITLVAQAPTTTLHNSFVTPISCANSQKGIGNRE